jgi:MFS family permease
MVLVSRRESSAAMKRTLLPGGHSPTFYLAFLASFLFFTSIHLLITPLPLFVESMGGSAIDVGLAGTTFAVAGLVLRPYMGRLVDTRGRKVALLLGTAIFTLGPLLYTMTMSVLTFQVARMLHGIGIGAFTSAYMALIADVTPPSRWGAALGLAGIAPSLSIILASPLGTSLLDHTSFTLVFLASSLTALAAFIVTLLIREPRGKTATISAEGHHKVHLLDVARQRAIVAPSLAMATLGFSYGTVVAFLPLFARGRDLGNVGLFFTALSLSLVVSRFAMGRLSDRVGRLTVVLPMFGILALGFFGLNWSFAFGTLITVAVIQGMGFGGARVGLETILADAAPAQARGTAFSLLYLCFDVGIAVSGLVMGKVADLAGYGQGYLLVGAVCLLTLVLFAAAMRKPATT